MLTLIIGRFVGGRTDIAERRMTPLPIVERFDVKENLAQLLQPCSPSDLCELVGRTLPVALPNGRFPTTLTGTKIHYGRQQKRPFLLLHDRPDLSTGPGHAAGAG
jgi:hypothetical protein